ncbi:hypothetical protein DIPPA_13977 [Diplonema papillatum]|nr:hypothetical protein DIPPA_13977 [Diplonema papillatum]
MLKRAPDKAWNLLKLTRGVATLEEAKASHRRLAVENHPDVGGSVEKMKLINEAFAGVKAELTRPSFVRPAFDSTQGPPQSGGAEPRQTQKHPGFTTMNRVTTRIEPQRAGANVFDGRLRRISQILAKTAGSGTDTKGPKLRATNPAHWGRAYGKFNGPVAE